MIDDVRTALALALSRSLDRLVERGDLPEAARVAPESIELTRPADRAHGDFATNVALKLAKPAGKPPRAIATALVSLLESGADAAFCERIAIAGPGFINFVLPAADRSAIIRTALTQGDNFGRATFGHDAAGQPRRVQVEFVSANPTGPLHVGHGRGAAYGASLAELLEFAGYDVTREYYVNDAGRQMNILAASVWLRALEAGGATLTFPANGYKGDYVRDIAAALRARYDDAFDVPIETVFRDLPADEPDGGDKETYIDAVIHRARERLGAERYRLVFDHGLNAVLDDIRDDLEGFGVQHDVWFSERSLTDTAAVERAIETLDAGGHLYEQAGALWFRSTAFGDDKDRVVRRDNGETTYFASDIAYHHDKFERGFDQIVNIWGADHHGYIPRVKAALLALGHDAERLDVQLVQFAILYRGAERVQMSTRSGSFVTLRELRDEVGRDAARFFYVQRRAEQHLDFDLELAKSQSNDNPVYYIQYAHARICSIQRAAAEQGVVATTDALETLTAIQEDALIERLARFPETIEAAARAREPHQVAQALRELAADFHSYYNAVRILDGEPAALGARLALIGALRQALANGLRLLGVNAPEHM